ncbi:integrase domain-containing protein [Corallincola platygyrae]|uniref:Integrase domain-containing protein n=1 Tax=Corallincola platygyrae TaxID=1193278 RepID=A0ABW4XPN0_9GAMM
MIKPPFNSSKNYGFGRAALNAAKRALKRAKGRRFGTLASHTDRFSKFWYWAKTKHKVADLSDINMEIIYNYAGYLRQRIERNQLKITYGHNLLSSVNVVYSCLGQEHRIFIKPSKALGRRQRIRTKPPRLDSEGLQTVFDDMVAEGFEREQICLELSDTFGLRRREACLLNCRLSVRQALRLGKVRITKGTKGGRGTNNRVQRWVEVDESGLQLLLRASSIQGKEENLVPIDLSLIQFFRRIRVARQRFLSPAGLGHQQDRRAAYACRKFKNLAGVSAPVFGKEEVVEKNLLESSTATLTAELGHGRKEVLSSYIGSLAKLKREDNDEHALIFRFLGCART